MLEAADYAGFFIDHLPPNVLKLTNFWVTMSKVKVAMTIKIKKLKLQELGL